MRASGHSWGRRSKGQNTGGPVLSLLFTRLATCICASSSGALFPDGFHASGPCHNFFSRSLPVSEHSDWGKLGVARDGWRGSFLAVHVLNGCPFRPWMMTMLGLISARCQAGFHSRVLLYYCGASDRLIDDRKAGVVDMSQHF